MPCGNGFGYTGTAERLGPRDARQEESPMNMLEYFKNWSDVVEFPKKAELFHEMDTADYMYVVLSGEVEVTLRGEPLGAELEGGIVGEMAMINDATRSATAVALTKVKAARVNREQFKRIIVDNPDFALHLMQVMANRLRVADQVIVG
jgi:CRP-like cAMP-binding protein